MREKMKSYAPLCVCVFLTFLACTNWSWALRALTVLLDVALPLIMGACVAYVVNILMNFYERRWRVSDSAGRAAKLRRGVCMTGAIITVVLIVAVISWLVIPQLVVCVQTLVERLPGAVEQLLAIPGVDEVLPEDVSTALEGINWQSAVSQLIEYLRSGAGGQLLGGAGTVISTVAGTLMDVVFTVIFALYLLSGKEKLAGQCRRLLDCYAKPAWRDRFYRAAALFNEYFHRYIVGQCLEAVILGTLCTLGMLVMGLPYATMIGPLVGVTALVPIIGAFFGAGVGAFMIVSISPQQAMIFLIFIIVLQQVEGNLIYPRVVGSQVGLPGVLILATVTVCGTLGGIMGMFAGVPIAAAIYSVIRADVHRREAESGENIESKSGGLK